LKHTIESGSLDGIVEDLVHLDSQVSKNLTRATREHYMSREVVNDAAEIFALVLVILNIDSLGAALWQQCTEESPNFFLKTMDYIQSGQTLQRETLSRLRQGLEKALMTWKGHLPANHWAAFQRFLG
jgi:hypothetical protein